MDTVYISVYYHAMQGQGRSSEILKCHQLTIVLILPLFAMQQLLHCTNFRTVMLKDSVDVRSNAGNFKLSYCHYRKQTGQFRVRELILVKRN